MESNVRFLSLNIGMKSNCAGVLSILVNKKLDVAFLQEVRTTDEQLESQVERYGYECKCRRFFKAWYSYCVEIFFLLSMLF